MTSPFARSSRRSTALFTALAFTLTSAAPGLALADEPKPAEPTATPAAPAPSGDAVAAEALFTEAQALLKAGDYKTACPKFAESYRLDPALGALLNLAVCHEREGKLATAWVEFKQGEAKAKAKGDAKYEAWAADRAAKLDARLPRLTISLIDPPDGVIVKRDGTQLNEAALSSAIPIDPGSHEITVRAPGHRAWSKKLELAEAQAVEIKVPKLKKLATGNTGGADDWKNSEPDFDTNPVEKKSTAPESTGSSTTTAGFVVTGLGVASIALGAVFTKLVADKKAIADDECPEKLCNAVGADAVSSAKSLAWGANVGFGLGAVGLLVGGYLLLRSDDPAPVATPSPESEARAKKPRSRGSRVRASLEPVVAPNLAYLGGRVVF